MREECEKKNINDLLYDSEGDSGTHDAQIEDQPTKPKKKKKNKRKNQVQEETTPNTTTPPVA
jgi:hypothetical protein